MGDPDAVSDAPLIKPVLLSNWVFDKGEIWQETFMEPPAFARFSSERGIAVTDATVIRLWQLGLLRADVIMTAQKLRRRGWAMVGKIEPDEYAYADNRPYKPYPAGPAAAGSALEPPSPPVKLFFHPFRFCVLWEYERLCRFIARPSLLTTGSVCARLLERFEEDQKRLGSGRVIAGFARANNIASLAVASEPCAYPRIFNRLRYPLGTAEETHRKDLARHARKLHRLYKTIGEQAVAKARDHLCHASSALEPNRDLHERLRLARNEVREKTLRGPLAGALFLKTVAEVLRRTAEDVFETQWPEEGETWSSSADYKERRYGARRVFDGDRRAADEVLRDFWPAFGLHARWYVEGDTEWAALDYVFGPNPSGIDLVNLRGRLNERSLFDQFQNDQKNGVYSIVSFDGDRPDNLRTLKQAARNEQFFGLRYVSSPDFEFENFSLAELQKILWQIAREKGARPARRRKLIENTKDADNKKKLLKGAGKLRELAHVSSGKDWGRRLMAFAEAHPKNEKGEDRPIVAAVHEALRAAHGWFSHRDDIRMLRVDPDTGKLIEK